jgi:hypothetical protein
MAHADQRWNDLGIGPLLSLPTLAKLGNTGEVPQALAHAHPQALTQHSLSAGAQATAYESYMYLQYPRLVGLTRR